MTTTDLFNFLSWDEYRARPEMNFSLLKEMALGADMFMFRESNPKEQTDAMLAGSVTHSRVLEPDQFGRQYTIWEGGKTQEGKFSMSRGTLAYKDLVASEAAQGRTVIDSKAVENAAAMRERIMNHETARGYLEGALVEQTVFWKCHGIEMKSRLDIVQPGKFLCDLKSARDIDTFNFGRSAGGMLYHAQAAMYRDAWAFKTGEILPFKVLAIESTAPYRINCQIMPEYALEDGQERYENWLKMLKQRRETGKYPGLYEGETDFELPGYMLMNSIQNEPFNLKVEGEAVTL